MQHLAQTNGSYILFDLYEFTIKFTANFRAFTLPRRDIFNANCRELTVNFINYLCFICDIGRFYLFLFCHHLTLCIIVYNLPFILGKLTSPSRPLKPPYTIIGARETSPMHRNKNIKE